MITNWGTGTGAALALALSSCTGVFNTGRDTYSELLNGIPRNRPPMTQEARSCLRAAIDQNDRSHSNRATDMSLIEIAAFFGAAGVGLTTGSTFVTDSDNEKRQWIAGSGAISIGIGGALLGLRTALNLGELSSSQTSAAAAQASLAMRITNPALTPEDREALYAECTSLSTRANSAYPGAAPNATPRNVSTSAATPAPTP